MPGASQNKKWIEAMGLVSELVVSVLLGLGIGYWGSTRWGWPGWSILIPVGIMATLGFWRVIRAYEDRQRRLELEDRE